MRLISWAGLVCCLLVAGVAAQTAGANRYEVELLANPTAGKKDTREVNAVLIFEKDRAIVKSRRSAEIFKEIPYSDIRFAEHSFSKRPWISQAAVSAIATAMTGLPFFIGNNEKHWLTVVADKDFFILKLENDNFRQIKAEFAIREIEFDEIDENLNKRQPGKTKRSKPADPKPDDSN